MWTSNDTDKNIISGPDFAALSDDELDKRVKDLKIISRARPLDKKRLVESLQRCNEGGCCYGTMEPTHGTCATSGSCGTFDG